VRGHLLDARPADPGGFGCGPVVPGPSVVPRPNCVRAIGGTVAEWCHSAGRRTRPWLRRVTWVAAAVFTLYG